MEVHVQTAYTCMQNYVHDGKSVHIMAAATNIWNCQNSNGNMGKTTRVQKLEKCNNLWKIIFDSLGSII